MYHPQDEVQNHSLTDPESFWGHQAEHLHWHKEPSAVLRRTTKSLESGDEHEHWEWFPDGEISTCYNVINTLSEQLLGSNPPTADSP
jgi:propionyl-CoA synthetase